MLSSSSMSVTKQAVATTIRRSTSRLNTPIIRMSRAFTTSSSSSSIVNDEAWRTMPLNPASLQEFSYAAPTWSHAVSSSYHSPCRQEDNSVAEHQHEQEDMDEEWLTRPLNSASLQEFSYAGPTWSHSLSYTSPESDFSSSFSSVRNDHSSVINNNKQTNKQQQNHKAKFESLTVSSPETASGSVSIAEFLNDDLIQKLVHTTTQDALRVLRPYEQLDSILPKTLQEVMGDTSIADEPRAMVVTKLQEPFEIVNVNEAWVALCGYTQEESRHRTLGELLQGPETNKTAVQETIEKLRQGKHASTTITNYTKAGRKFRNHLTMGPLYDSHQRLTHFVGVLQEERMPEEKQRMSS